MYAIVPNKATPGGCIIGAFGLCAWIIAGLCGWALYLASRLPPERRDSHLVAMLWVGAASSIVVGSLLVWVGWRLAQRADMSDPFDPDRPKIRW